LPVRFCVAFVDNGRSANDPTSMVDRRLGWVENFQSVFGGDGNKVGIST